MRHCPPVSVGGPRNFAGGLITAWTSLGSLAGSGLKDIAKHSYDSGRWGGGKNFSAAADRAGPCLCYKPKASGRRPIMAIGEAIMFWDRMFETGLITLTVISSAVLVWAILSI